MTEFDLGTMGSSEKQPLEEAIYDYRKRHQGPPPDYDAKFVMDILHQVNDSSPVRIAIDPVTYFGWDKNASMFGIKSVTIEGGKLVLSVHRDKKTFSASELYDLMTKEFKLRPNKHIPIAFKYHEEVHVLTDAYSHSLRRDMFAGLPFDIVLAETTPDAKKKPAEEE